MTDQLFAIQKNPYVADKVLKQIIAELLAYRSKAIEDCMSSTTQTKLDPRTSAFHAGEAAMCQTMLDLITELTTTDKEDEEEAD